jgi:cell division septal protein FtsQ
MFGSRRERQDNIGRLRPGEPEAKNTGAWLERTGRRAGVLLLSVAIVVSLVNILSVSPHARIEPLTSSKAADGALLRSHAEYQAAADKLLGSSIWNRNKITINTDQISHQLAAEFPELSSASVTLPLLAHRPTVYVQPAEASLVVAADNGAFVIDQNGRALMPSSNLPTARNLPQVVDQSGLQIGTGRQVLPSDNVAFIQTVQYELGAKHVHISSMVLPAAARELDAYIEGQPYFVKFNLANDDARQQAGTYLATAAELHRQHTTPKHYIDVRVDGRAYYK